MAADPGPPAWARTVQTTNAIVRLNYARFAQPAPDHFETVIGDTVTNVVVGTNVAQVWVGFQAVAGSHYTLEFLEPQSRTWMSTGGFLSASTNGFHRMWDDVSVDSRHRVYRVTRWTD